MGRSAQEVERGGILEGIKDLSTRRGDLVAAAEVGSYHFGGEEDRIRAVSGTGVEFGEFVHHTLSGPV